MRDHRFFLSARGFTATTQLGHSLSARAPRTDTARPLLRTRGGSSRAADTGTLLCLPGALTHSSSIVSCLSLVILFPLKPTLFVDNVSCLAFYFIDACVLYYILSFPSLLVF